MHVDYIGNDESIEYDLYIKYGDASVSQVWCIHCIYTQDTVNILMMWALLWVLCHGICCI